MEHFLALCCFGGEPFLDFHRNSTIDPTDWSADVVEDYNMTGMLETTKTGGFSPSNANCKMFNITFTNLADQGFSDGYKANFECRCPTHRFGVFCELSTPTAQALSQSAALSPPHPMVMLLVIAAVVLALMAVLAMMVKGCFCDCFGPFSREDPYDKPLDPEDVRKCLQKVRENQAAREIASEPLVSHPPPLQHLPPMVADSYSAPYSQGPQMGGVGSGASGARGAGGHGYPSAPPMNYRPPSPPPAYSDIDKTPATFKSTHI